MMRVLTHTDSRGRLESVKDFPFSPKEVLVASNVKGKLKGLHLSPYRKIVYVSEGAIHDFFVKDPPSNQVTETFLGPGQWIVVPANAGHGFYCEKDSLVLYFLEETYDASKDRVIYWASPDVAFRHAFLDHVCPKSLIMSQSDAEAFYAVEYDYVVLGARGFIGTRVVSTLRQLNRRVLECATRLDDHKGLDDALTRSRAPYVICCAGISGKPTIQWSEDHITETFETNVLDVCNLVRLCHRLGKHLTYLGSGLVYSFREGARTEQETPDATDHVYCRYRVMLEAILREAYSTNQLLYLRVLYPCAFDGHASCFFQKMLTRSQQVNETRVSLTILPDLLPLLPEIIEDKRLTGILNFVNPGSISLSEMLHAANVEHQVSSSRNARTMSEVLDTTKFVESVHLSIPSVFESVLHHAKVFLKKDLM